MATEDWQLILISGFGIISIIAKPYYENTYGIWRASNVEFHFEKSLDQSLTTLQRRISRTAGVALAISRLGDRSGSSTIQKRGYRRNG